MEEVILEESSPRRILSAGVEIPYDVRFTPPALDWLVRVAELAGGTRTETDNLRLATDETLNFLINAYPDAESWELIRLEFGLNGNGDAEIAIANAGPPVHLDRIPTYDPAAGSKADLDGLWYFLAREAVDSLEFVNLGMDGWRVLIRKRLEAPAACPGEQCARHAPRLATRPNFTTRPATPGDAAELMDLTYDTYRYSYPGDAFYHRARLAEAIEHGELICIVVESDGMIAGTFSVCPSARTPDCAYLSSLMVRREFRNTRAIMVVIRENSRYMDDNPLDVDLYYGTMVTAHPASQKAGAKCGLTPLALLLRVGAAVDYRSMNIHDGPRESFLLCARLVKPATIPVIHLPAAHHEVMRPLLDQTGCRAALSAGTAEPDGGDTRFFVDEDPIEGTAYVTIESMGPDWAMRLRRKLFALKGRSMQAIIVLIPAWQPQPDGIDRTMEEFNGIFTGLKPVSATEFFSVYSVLQADPDFDAIRLADPLAEALREHVRHHFLERIAEQP